MEGLVLEVRLELVPVGDVLEHRDLVRRLAPFVADQRERQVDDDLLAGGAQVALLAAEVVELAEQQALVELPDRGGVVGMGQLAHRALLELLDGVAEHLREGRVDLEDAAVHVPEPDPDGGLVEHGPEPRLARVQGLLGLVAGREHGPADRLLLVEGAVAQRRRVGAGQRAREGPDRALGTAAEELGEPLGEEHQGALERGRTGEVRGDEAAADGPARLRARRARADRVDDLGGDLGEVVGELVGLHRDEARPLDLGGPLAREDHDGLDGRGRPGVDHGRSPSLRATSA